MGDLDIALGIREIVEIYTIVDMRLEDSGDWDWMLVMGNAVVGEIEWTIISHIKNHCAIDPPLALKIWDVLDEKEGMACG